MVKQSKSNSVQERGSSLNIHQTLDELQYQVHLTKIITDNTTSSLFMVDDKGYPTFMNPAAEKLTGYKLDEIKDKPLHYAIHYKYPDGRPYPMEECPLDNSYATLTPMQNQEEIFVDKCGRLFPVIWSVSPLEKNGVTIGGVIEFRDVTLEKKAEEERLQAVKQAEAYEHQRAEALLELDKAKTIFFSNVSHELRTPLTLILAPLEDALADCEQPLLPKEQERYRLIQRNALRLLKLVNSLLDFSRIEAKRMQAIYEPTDLSQLTTDLTSLFRSTFERAGLQLIVNTPSLEEPVYVDREMWEKIIFNLLSNAFKFTLQGTILVSLEKKESNSELRVQDSGTGIAPAELPRLFERFHRIESSPGRSYEGTGIGLALVQELVKLHGGDIHVESQLGQGSTFIIKIPFGTAHLPSEQLGQQRNAYQPGSIGTAYIEEAVQWLAEKELPPQSIQQQETIDKLSFVDLPHSGRQATIVVADDNGDMRNYIQNLLGAYWQVIAVKDGEEALSAIERYGPDLVITDVMMPKMNGFELLSALRAKPTLSLIPVIMCSARSNEEAKIEGLEAGADDYLEKPFTAKELLAHVNTHLQLGRIRKTLKNQVEQEIKERLQIEQRLLEEQIQLKLSQEYRRKQENFIDTLCHELRNPLSGIYGSSVLLKDELRELKGILKSISVSFSPFIIDTLETLFVQLNNNIKALKQCVEQQKSIVNDVLDLSRLENDRVELNEEPFNVAETLQKVQLMFESQRLQKKLTWDLQLADVNMLLKADASRLNQVVINLISNAIKFTTEGTITLKACTQPLSLTEV